MVELEISTRKVCAWNVLLLLSFFQFNLCVYSRLSQPLSISMIDLLIFSIFSGIGLTFISKFLNFDIFFLIIHEPGGCWAPSLALHLNFSKFVVGFRSRWVLLLKLYMGFFFFFIHFFFLFVYATFFWMKLLILIFFKNDINFS